MRRVKLLDLLLIGGALSGCAHVDTGQVDYRVAEAPPPGADIEKAILACHADATKCGPLTNSHLIRKYVSAQAPFQAEDVYSVELEQAVIGDRILEGFVPLVGQVGKHGEFAILANAFEFMG